MRRNRTGPGYSGSTTYLAKAFKQTEAAFDAAFAALDLVPPPQGEKPRITVIGEFAYWLTKDGRGVTWINGRQASAKELAAAAQGAPAGVSAPAVGAPEGEQSVNAEPAIFKAVPRMLPPVPEPVVEPAAVHAVASVPAEEPVVPAAATETVAPAADAVPVAGTQPSAVEEAAEKPAKASRPRKAKAAGDATAATKPRTKKRVSSAIEADAAADEPSGAGE
jgi:hypothetical protein